MFRAGMLFLIIMLVGCKTSYYYVVRHAEKESSNTMTSDVPLSLTGRQHANDLGNRLKNENLKHIYSTNFTRTVETATPLSEMTGIPILRYNRVDSLLEKINKIRGNTLIVGHSNTVDDIVNGLAGKTLINGDLPDTSYGELFIISRRAGKFTFRKERYVAH